MKLTPFILLCVFNILFSGCFRENKQITDNSKTKDSAKKAVKSVKTDNIYIDTPVTINLQYGFKIKASKRENLQDFTTYHYLEFWHNNAKVFTDTTKEYVFNDKHYPIINKLKSDVFEILIDYNDRPSPDKLVFLRVENDKIVKQDVFPFFEKNPVAINGVLEYSGWFSDSEMWQKDGKMYGPYNPNLFYKVTADGIKLDSAITILKNKEEYGKFYGFRYNEHISFVSVNGKIDTAEKDILKD